MPRGRKRKDPTEAPIDGDYSLDQVLNKDPDFAYGLVDPDDMAKYRSLGYVAETRGPDAAKPRYDQGTEADSGYKVRALTLMKLPKALRERLDNQAIDISRRRMSAIKASFEVNGGEFGRPPMA